MVLLAVLVLLCIPPDKTYTDFCKEQSGILLEKFVLPCVLEFNLEMETEMKTLKENGIMCWILPESTICHVWTTLKKSTPAIRAR